MLKLNVGLSRKVGEANYGSRGASVNLELEVESALAGDPQTLQDRIRSLFRLARASVDEELNGNGQANGHHGNGHNQNGHSNGSRRSNGRSATASQVRAIHAIATPPENAPVNALGIRRIMFAVDDLDDLVARLLARGAELVGEVVQYEDTYRLAYIRGPEGLIVALAQQLG